MSVIPPVGRTDKTGLSSFVMVHRETKSQNGSQALPFRNYVDALTYFNSVISMDNTVWAVIIMATRTRGPEITRIYRRQVDKSKGRSKVKVC